MTGVETIRNPPYDPEKVSPTKPEHPPDDQRLARLQKALGGTALRGAGMEDPSRHAAAERVGPLAVRDEVALRTDPERDEPQRDDRR